MERTERSTRGGGGHSLKACLLDAPMASCCRFLHRIGHRRRLPRRSNLLPSYVQAAPGASAMGYFHVVASLCGVGELDHENSSWAMLTSIKAVLAGEVSSAKETRKQTRIAGIQVTLPTTEELSCVADLRIFL